MYVLFEETGKFLTARVMSRADSSCQVEMDSGKRVKLKATQVLLEFEANSASDFIAKAEQLASSMDVQLAWEFAPDEEFAFGDVAKEYFNAQASLEEQAASLICLWNAPHYFRRAGKGRFRKASAEIVAQALAAIEKKKLQLIQIQTWADELISGHCPEPIRAQLYKILFRPDKNALEYKAVVEASRQSKTAPLDLLQNCGAIASAYEFHWQRFLFDQFPTGTGFPLLQAPQITDDLPLADVQAISIDDSETTEIDDALSVQGIGTGRVTLGIHIAAPALAIQPEQAIDKLARNRYSTVYMPGQKITMLPDNVVQGYTLQEGRACPALSLYLTYEESSLVLLGSQTRLEKVPIVANLRHDVLDAHVSHDWLCSNQADLSFLPEIPSLPAYSLHSLLSFLYQLANHLKAQREQVRGKPETFNRPDYNFRIAKTGQPLTGDEKVDITTRRRGAPLDLMVAEAMILANNTWGQWLAQLGVPGIYRSQSSLAPGVKVRMSTKALPHAGIGVQAYAWSTSPLRRYVDLVNQWQIIACVRHGNTAALAAPFKPKDAALFGIVSGFDAAYTAYNSFQTSMERYWTIRYVQQRSITELTATVVKEGLVRAEEIPLLLSVAGITQAMRGARVRVRLGEIDLLLLEASASLIEHLEAQTITSDEDDDDLPGTGVQLALDVNEIPQEGSAAA
jgi:exoribonuclease II